MAQGNIDQGRQFVDRIIEIKERDYPDMKKTEFSRLCGKYSNWYTRIHNDIEKLGYGSFLKICESLGYDVRFKLIKRKK